MSMTVTATDAGPEGTRHLSVVQTEADVLTSRLCELAGHIHAATAELVSLLGELERCGGWQGVGLRSIGHWASIELGIDARTASAQARAGLLLATVPEIARAARAGELGWDKLELVVRVVEPASESHWLTLAREMSVGQLRRVVSAYRRASGDTGDPDGHERCPAPAGHLDLRRARRPRAGDRPARTRRRRGAAAPRWPPTSRCCGAIPNPTARADG